jgi:hypothetical protein
LPIMKSTGWSINLPADMLFHFVVYASELLTVSLPAMMILIDNCHSLTNYAPL